MTQLRAHQDGYLALTNSERGFMNELKAIFYRAAKNGGTRHTDYLRVWDLVELVAKVRITHGYGVSATQIIQDLQMPEIVFIMYANSLEAGVAIPGPASSSLKGYSQEVIALDQSLSYHALQDNTLRRLMGLLRLKPAHRRYMSSLARVAIGDTADTVQIDVSIS